MTNMTTIEKILDLVMATVMGIFIGGYYHSAPLGFIAGVTLFNAFLLMAITR